MHRYKIVPLILLAAAIVMGGSQAGAAEAGAGAKSGASAGKGTAAPKAAPTPAVNKYPDLDEKMKTAQQNLAEVQKMLTAINAEVSTASLALFGTNQEEFEERAQMIRSLNYETERSIELINRQRKLRDEQVDPGDEATQVQAFLGQAPFTMEQVDALRGQILDVKLKLNSTETRRALSASEIERTRKELKDSEVRLRQIQEQLESVNNKADERRLRWQLEQARLTERLAQARLTAYEISRASQDIDMASQHQALGMLERKLAIAVANAPFPKSELDAKLERLRETLRQLQKEQEAARLARETTAQKLEEAREELRLAKEKLATLPAPPAPAVQTAVVKSSASATGTMTVPVITTPPEKLPPPDPETAKQMEKVAQLQAMADLRKDESDAASTAYMVLRFVINFLDDQQNIWQVRFRNTNPNDPEQYQEIQKWLTEGLDKVAQRKISFQTNLDVQASLIAGTQKRLEIWKPGAGDIKVLRQILAAQQARADAYRRGMDQTRDYERLLQSWQVETQERLSHVTLGERLTGWRHVAWGWMEKLWNIELFAAQETVIVDGKSVTTKVRSITVGKLVTAVLMLLVGIWLIHRIALRARWTAVKRFRARDTSARLLYKSIFVTGMLLVILVTLTSLKIPLTIFAFLGGALAIGVGFGAQNLINNFISGMILIFERPIKVNDIVEVDGLRGKVVSIGGRCSRIKRFDGIDILIPNSSFLEKNVVNWTHSDLLLRLKISVGVAYGSPAREVLKLIMRAVEEHGQVLKDPAPVAIFDDFGDSALMFVVYFWVEQRDGIDSRVISSDVRFRIEKLFREANITMAYPQRDVHLDVTQPIPVSVVGDGRSAEFGTRNGD